MANYKPVNILATAAILLFMSWSTYSFAQSEQRLHASLQAAIPEEPHRVEIGVQIDQIVNVDQKAENFQVVGNLRMEWDHPEFAFEVGENERQFKVFSLGAFTKYVDEKGLFAPGFLIHNQQGRRFTQLAEVTIFKDGHAIYFERFTATLQAPDFDFIQHPFDKQTFYVRVDALLPGDFVKFMPMEGYSKLGGQLGEEEWKFTRSWVSTDEVEGTTGKQTSRFSFGFEASRHLDYYYLRIFLPLIVIVLVSWFTFFLNDYGKRVDMAIANLLVFVAFNFTVGNDLPRLGYLTFIDAIMFASFLFAGLVVLVNVIYRRMEVQGNENMARNLDRYTIWIYPFTLVVLVILCWVWFVVAKIHL